MGGAPFIKTPFFTFYLFYLSCTYKNEEIVKDLVSFFPAF